MHQTANGLQNNLPRGGFSAAGLSTRDTRAQLEDVYGLKVSADLINRVRNALPEDVSEWQNRALEPMYPIAVLNGRQ